MDLISGQNLQQYVEQNGPVNQKRVLPLGMSVM